MNNETKSAILEYSKELDKELSVWQKIGNTFVFIYYVSPFGYYFHHDTYKLYHELFKILKEAREEEKRKTGNEEIGNEEIGK